MLIILGPLCIGDSVEAGNKVGIMKCIEIRVFLGFRGTCPEAKLFRVP